MKQRSTTVKVFAVDLAKRSFQVAGEDRHGVVVFESRYRSREAFREFLGTLQAGQQVLMETGPGAQAWARVVQSHAAQARLLPAQRVREHRSGAKNDRKDTLALLRAGRDTAIHDVPVKSVEHLALQALHRVRRGYIRRRTALSNQMRGLLLEHGVAMARGDAALCACLSGALADASVPLPMCLREILAELWAEWETLGKRLARLSGQIEQTVVHEPLAQRLMTIPGIGPITGSAMACKELPIERFASARQFAASFGIVPDQHSSGESIRLGKMCKRGDRYIRSLLIEGAHAVLRRVQPEAQGNRLQRWVLRHGRRGAAVRLANRNARIAWALLRRQTTYHTEKPSMR